MEDNATPQTAPDNAVETSDPNVELRLVAGELAEYWATMIDKGNHVVITTQYPDLADRLDRLAFTTTLHSLSDDAVGPTA